jgi:transcriptional regulator with XRE-family HTH domain
MSCEQVRAFGREVRRRRIALNLSLETLGQRTGFTAGYVGNVESGKRPCGLSLAAAFRIAKGLGTDVCDLVGGFQGLSPTGLEAGRLIEAMPAPTRDAAIRLLRALAHRGART